MLSNKDLVPVTVYTVQYLEYGYMESDELPLRVQTCEYVTITNMTEEWLWLPGRTFRVRTKEWAGGREWQCAGGEGAHSRRAARRCRCRSRDRRAEARAAGASPRPTAAAPASGCRSSASRCTTHHTRTSQHEHTNTVSLSWVTKHEYEYSICTAQVGTLDKDFPHLMSWRLWTWTSRLLCDAQLIICYSYSCVCVCASLCARWCVLGVDDGGQRLALVQLGDAAHPLLHLLRVSLHVLDELHTLHASHMHCTVLYCTVHKTPSRSLQFCSQVFVQCSWWVPTASWTCAAAARGASGRSAAPPARPAPPDRAARSHSATSRLNIHINELIGTSEHCESVTHLNWTCTLYSVRSYSVRCVRRSPHAFRLRFSDRLKSSRSERRARTGRRHFGTLDFEEGVQIADRRNELGNEGLQAVLELYLLRSVPIIIGKNRILWM